MNSITTRPCKLTDDMRAICDLIFLTDDYIYPPMFRKSPEELYSFFGSCIKDENSAFYYKNIFLALDGDEILGIIVSFKGNVVLTSEQSLDKYLSKSDILFCDEHYFTPLFSEYSTKKDITYLSNVCVKPSARNRKIGKKMLSDFLSITEGIVELDVLCDNPAAIRLYQSLGFSILYDEDAFAFEPIPNFKSYRMRKQAEE